MAVAFVETSDPSIVLEAVKRHYVVVPSLKSVEATAAELADDDEVRYWIQRTEEELGGVMGATRPVRAWVSPCLPGLGRWIEVIVSGGAFDLPLLCGLSRDVPNRRAFACMASGDAWASFSATDGRIYAWDGYLMDERAEYHLRSNLESKGIDPELTPFGHRDSDFDRRLSGDFTLLVID